MRLPDLGQFAIGGGPLTLVAGPCTAESRSLCEDVAGEVATVCKELGFPFVFKASFDKANRSSGGTSRGPGLEALEWIAAAGRMCGAPTTTDIHLPEQAAVAAPQVDMIQIPAFLCRQSDLLQAAAATGKPVNVKKGQFLAPWDVRNIVDKLASFGASGAMVTERGTTFGYNTLVVDMPGLETMRGFGVAVCFDATHSAQRPGAEGASSGGARETIPALARAAAAVGIDALFVETHPSPERALSDAATQWPLGRLRELLEPVAAVHRAAYRPKSPA
jgi:2-dehydro-3-deoxyphosphooctonate aldolase (KDO 8-P synthase)